MRIGLFISIIVLVLIACEKEAQNESPVALFKTFPYSGNENTSFVFDPSESYDKNTYPEKLMFLWDWQSDGIWDTSYIGRNPIAKRFNKEGTTIVTMGVKDERNEIDVAIDSVYLFPKAIKSSMTDPRDNREYKIVKIGESWWMAENLKFGKLIPIDSIQTDNGLVEMYAYNDDPQLIEKYGGLYNWDEAMAYTEEEGSQGICPPGWHIPSLNDWKSFSKDILSIALYYYYGENGPGGLNLDYGGYILRYYEVLDRATLSNISRGINKRAFFWTSSHDVNLWRDFSDLTATKRENRAIANFKIEDYYNNDYFKGFYHGSDKIHLYGNINVYYMQHPIPLVNEWFSFYVRCRKD